MLQDVVGCCCVVQFVAARATARCNTHCNAQCNTLSFTLQHTATHCNTLQHTSTLTGSTKKGDCTCNSGYAGSDASHCNTHRQHKEGRLHVQQWVCRIRRMSLQHTLQNALQYTLQHTATHTGSTKKGDCMCNIGYAGSDASHCQICPAGFFCPGHGVVTLCRPGTTSMTGSGLFPPPPSPHPPEHFWYVTPPERTHTHFCSRVYRSSDGFGSK